MTVGCPNEACDHGWVRVDPVAYGELRWPITDDMTAEQVKAAEYRRRHYSEAYRPCEECRPGQFTRWANGCFGPDHKAKSCALCLEALGEKAATRHDKAVST